MGFRRQDDPRDPVVDLVAQSSFPPHTGNCGTIVCRPPMTNQELASELEEVSQLVATGRLPVRAFNRRQVAEEDRKVALFVTQPVLAEPLRRLEDHPLLQGCLASFDFSATNFERRAAVFDEVFSRATELPVPAAKAALLACGDYSQRNSMGRFQFGAEKREVWRDLLRAGNKCSLTSCHHWSGASPDDGRFPVRPSSLIPSAGR